MSKQNTHNLLEKIALLIQEEYGGHDLAFISESLCNINSRLDSIEAQLSTHSTQSSFRNSQLVHPSLEKMRIIEEVVEEIFSAGKGQRLCTFEPHNKPCDNCSLCNTRGF